MEPSGQPIERPNVTSKRQLLRQISLFTNLTDGQLDLVAARSRIVEFKKDELIYQQGHPPDAFYALISGRVRAFVENTAGKSESLDILHRGDFFGMTSLLTNEPHSVTTQAQNDSILIRIKRVDFELMLKEIPEIAIHLSTTLSRRLRQKDMPFKQVFESTLISIYSPVRESGRTLYALNLASSLRKETGKKVILVDLSATGDAVCKALATPSCPIPMHLKGVSFDQSKVAAAIAQHPDIGIDTLNIAHDPSITSDVTQITPLLSYLANLYHYVVTDLPHELDRTVFKALVQADRIHLVSNDQPQQLEATARLLRELSKTIQQAQDRVKVIINEAEEDIHSENRQRVLDYPVHATLPAFHMVLTPGRPLVLADPTADYSRAVRRISREIGEVLVGLALGSGAALGLAHIGVIRVLEREGIPIDIVAGSSIGALMGAFWGAGMSSYQMEEAAAQFKNKTSLMKLFDPAIPKFGILAGNGVTKLLRRYLGNLTFRDMKFPVKITAVDYTRRELIVLDEGSVVDAVRASVSIPAIFEPIKLRDRWLIDGGVLDPVPVDVLMQAGVHKIIAVNALPSPDDIHKRHQALIGIRHRLLKQAQEGGWQKRIALWARRKWWNWMDSNIFDVIMHTMQGMEYVLAEAGCSQADVALHPIIPRLNWFEFYCVDELVQRGIEEAEAHLPEIKRLAFET